ncbi:hypothetical protein CMU93_05760 [Elizabethkingia anophelis]|nr:hypothetical protein [Elizabethkingia anophelis]
MKQKNYNKTALTLFVLFFLMSSCRSAGSDNSENITDPPVNVGNSSVFLNLSGTEFSESDGNNLQASTGKRLRQASETYYTLIDPSTLLAAEVSEESSVPLKVSAGINPVAAEPGGDLASGTQFRAIAYQASDGSYVDYKDFTIGASNTSGGLKLTAGTPYNIVVYSHGTNSLPNFDSSSEGLNFSSAMHKYDSTTDGFLYWKRQTPFTPNIGDNTIDNVILRHRIAGVTVKINSGTISNTSYIDNITSATLKNHNRTTTFDIRFGNVVVGSRDNPQAVQVIFNPNIQNSATEWISDQLFVNADSGGDKTISFQGDVKIGTDTKTIKADNAFKIQPGFRTVYTIKLTTTKCGALVQGAFREFECYNVGATKNGNPFVGLAEIHGGKYQWNGTAMSQEKDQQNDDLSPSAAGFGTGKISDADGKKLDILCSPGYRVPSAEEWVSFKSDNTFVENTGSYDKGAIVSYGGKTTLFLPFAGYRNYDYEMSGQQGSKVFKIIGRGFSASYWSTTGSNNDWSTNNSNALALGPSSILPYGYTVNVTTANPRINGASVRCIKKLPTDP